MEFFPWRKMCLAAKHALICFFMSVFVFGVSIFSGKIFGHTKELWALAFWGPALYFCLINFALKYLFRGFIYEVKYRVPR